MILHKLIVLLQQNIHNFIKKTNNYSEKIFLVYCFCVDVWQCEYLLFFYDF